MKDIGKLGLRCGIEIHQQLDTGKLFCSCPSALADSYDYEIIRRLHPVPGENDSIDIAALHEKSRKRRVIYEYPKDSACLVESDEEPPHDINTDALKNALQLALLLKSDIPPYMQVMRKTIVDGSNTSGFQRTALLAGDGKIEVNDKKIKIESISLEEDSARIIDEKAGEVRFRLDRLGIPLIEIATAPDINTPEEGKAAAKKLGSLLRSLPDIKRGLGTIRQDINVSIRRGNRVEIKGAQDLNLIPDIIRTEALRQLNIIEIKDELKKRSVKLSGERKDVTSIFNKTRSKLILNSLKEGSMIIALKLEGYSSLISKEYETGTRIGREFADIAKASGLKGILHSDELPNYGIEEKEVRLIRKTLKCGREDAFVIITAERTKAETTADAVLERAGSFLKGVPSEVRKASPDSTTRFLRPMPGAARMYPETDIDIIRLDLKEITPPETIDNKSIRYALEYHLSKDLAEKIALSGYNSIFEKIVSRYKVKPSFAAETFLSTFKEIKKVYALDPSTIKEEDILMLFKLLEEDIIHKDIFIDALIDIIKGKFSKKNYASLSTEEIHRGIKDIIKKNEGAPFSALMGIAMKRFKGKVSGNRLSEMIKAVIEKEI